MTFDARAIKLLQPGAHLISPDHPGLRLEASRLYRTWIYRYKSPIDGRMRQMRLGRWPAMSISSAVVAWEQRRGDRDGGADPAAQAREARVQTRAQAEAARVVVAQRAYSVRRLCDDYLAGHVELHRVRKGADEVTRMFATMLGAVADVPAAELTRAQAFALIKSLADTAPVQAAKLRAELGAAWDYAIDAGALPETAPNWWRLILRGKIRSKGKKIAGEHVGTAKRVLSPDELGAVIKWLPNFSALIEDALTLYLWTGTRGSEIMAIEGREVRELDGVLWWTIPKAKTKNARHPNASDLRVPLFGRARAVVLRRLALHGDGWLFPTRRRDGVLVHSQQKVISEAVYYHQPYSSIRTQVVRPRLPVSHWGPHDLRRSARTLLSSMGCPREIAEAVLGHMPPGVVGVYDLHRYDAERVVWLMRLDERLEGLGG